MCCIYIPACVVYVYSRESSRASYSQLLCSHNHEVFSSATLSSIPLAWEPWNIEYTAPSCNTNFKATLFCVFIFCTCNYENDSGPTVTRIIEYIEFILTC